MRAGQLRAPRRWEQLLVEAAVIGSRDRWRRRLEGLANDLRARRVELEDEDETAATAVARTLDDLAAFTAFALPLIDLLAGWPSTADWGDWLEYLGGLATRALKRPDRVLAVLAELAPLAPVGPVSLGEVVDILAPLLLEQAVPPPPQRYGSVFVGPVEAARGALGIVGPEAYQQAEPEQRRRRIHIARRGRERQQCEERYARAKREAPRSALRHAIAQAPPGPHKRRCHEECPGQEV